MPAAIAALADAAVDASDIDLLICATVTPDMMFPTSSALLADALGMPKAAAYDLLAGCTGFVYAIAQAYGMLASGLSRRALVVGGDVLSKILDWEDRSTLVLFGDGAGAVVMEPVERGGFLGFELGADGGGGENLWYPGSGSRKFENPEALLKMNGREVFKFATRIMVYSAQQLLPECGKTVEDIDVYIPHQANKRIIDYAVAKLGIPSEKTVVNVDRYGNTSSGSIPLALADARAEGRLQRRSAGSDDRYGRRPHVGLGADGMDEREALMSKVAFCFPGQGSLEMGMGREIAEAFPAAREVYRVGSEASGSGSREALLRDAARADRRDGGAAAGARRDEPRDPRGDARARPRAGRRRRPLGRRVRSAGGSRLARDRRGDRPRSRARPRDGRGRTPAARARWRRSSGSRTRRSRSSAGRIVGVWPANYNCPGQIVVSGEHEAVEECCAEAESLGARRAVKLKVSGAFHSPLVARAADRLRPALERVRFTEPLAPFMSTVTAKVEPAQRIAALLVDQLTGPGAIHAGGDRARPHGRDDVRRGRSRQRALRPREAHRPQREDDVREHARQPGARAGSARAVTQRVLLARREERARHGRLARDRPRDRDRPRRRRRLGRPLVPDGRRRGGALAAEIGARAVQADVSDPESARALVEEAGDLDILVNNAGVTRDGLLVRMSDDDWNTVIDTNLASCFYTCRAAARGMMKKRSGTVVNISSIVGLRGNWGQTNYAASKAGIIGFTKSLARELGSRNVRANVVVPGYVKTQLTDVLPDGATDAMLQNTPLGRLGDPEDVAGAVRFLCSDEASFITGAVLLVDGGLGM